MWPEQWLLLSSLLFVRCEDRILKWLSCLYKINLLRANSDSDVVQKLLRQILSTHTEEIVHVETFKKQ